jgi:hypothetical protein
MQYALKRNNSPIQLLYKQSYLKRSNLDISTLSHSKIEPPPRKSKMDIFTFRQPLFFSRVQKSMRQIREFVVRPSQPKINKFFAQNADLICIQQFFGKKEKKKR